MITKYLKFFVLLIFSSSLLAQELHFCESFTEDGTPVGPLNSLEIKPYGTAIYVLVENIKNNDDPQLYLFLDKLVDGKFTPFDSKIVMIEEDKNWAVTSFEFKEEGIYEAYFLNSSQARLASSKIEVYFSGEFSSRPTKYLNYSLGDCEFIFCEMVINGKPINAFNILSLARTEGQAFFFLNNHVRFGIEKIKVQVWKRSNGNSNYEQLVDSRKYKILPEWKDTFIKYVFTNPGEYKVDVFDFEDNFIASNVLTVTN